MASFSTDFSIILDRHHLMKDTQEDIVKAALQPADPELDDEPEDDDTDILRRGFKDLGSENDGRDGSVG